MQYYSCINCGHHGDFGYERKRSLNCENCDYDMITGLDDDEYNNYLQRNTTTYQNNNDLSLFEYIEDYDT
jgi:hypothetical protein